MISPRSLISHPIFSSLGRSLANLGRATFGVDRAPKRALRRATRASH